MKKILSSLIVLFCFGIFMVGVYGDEEKEIEVDLKDVPAKIVEAVKEKVKGIEIKEVDLVIKKEYKIYEFDGIADGKEYEIEVKVDSEGNIIDVEVEEEADDEEDEDVEQDEEDEEHDEAEHEEEKKDKD